MFQPLTEQKNYSSDKLAHAQILGAKRSERGDSLFSLAAIGEGFVFSLSSSADTSPPKKLDMYAVVKFLDENDAPGVVCENWLMSDDICMYPNVKSNEARDKLLKRNAEPVHDWSQCRIKILHRYNSFSKAITQLRQAEETSNLDSEEEILTSKSRKRSRNHLLYPGEESDEEEYSTSLISKKDPRYGSCRTPYPVPPQQQCSSPSISQCPSPSLPQCPSPSLSAKTMQSNKSAAGSSTSIMNGRLISWMADISHQVKQLQSQVALVLKNQEKILKKQQQMPDSEDDDETLGNLPVCDNQSFLELNKKISEESHFRHLLIKVLVSVGGKDVRSLVHNMLKRLLTDEVAELYSLTGKSSTKGSSKKPFFCTEVSKLIFSACKKVFKDCVTEVKVKEAVGDWLHQAKFRKVRRIQRE